MVPYFTTPGPKPVILVPGETPRFPLMTVRPVLVTVEPPRTPNEAADASGTSPFTIGHDAAASGPKELPLIGVWLPTLAVCTVGAKPEVLPALPLPALQPVSNAPSRLALKARL